MEEERQEPKRQRRHKKKLLKNLQDQVRRLTLFMHALTLVDIVGILLWRFEFA